MRKQRPKEDKIMIGKRISNDQNGLLIPTQLLFDYSFIYELNVYPNCYVTGRVLDSGNCNIHTEQQIMLM